MSHHSFQVLDKTGDENDFENFSLESLFRSHSPYKLFMSYYTSRFQQPVAFPLIINIHLFFSLPLLLFSFFFSVFFSFRFISLTMIFLII